MASVGTLQIVDRIVLCRHPVKLPLLQSIARKPASALQKTHKIQANRPELAPAALKT